MEPINDILGIDSTASAQVPGPRELGQDDFLRLLVTQLQNQDPLQPIDNAAFVAELAQFSELEQSAKQVRLLEEANTAQAEALRFSMLPLVGRQVRINGAVIQLESDPVPLSYNLAVDAQSTRITIQDSTGSTIRTLELGPQVSGAHQVEWDGKDQNGVPMPAGIYRYALTTIDTSGESVDTSASSVLTVTGLRVEQGQPLLLIGDDVLDPSFVIDLL